MAGLATLPWDKIALLLAIIYNIHLLAGWWWDRWLRDMFVQKGWFKPTLKQRRKHKMKELQVAEAIARHQEADEASTAPAALVEETP
jgi:hypothetical protein